MLSASLSELISHLVTASTTDTRLIRLTPVSTAEAQAACTIADRHRFDDDTLLALRDAGIVLDERDDERQSGLLVWARLDWVPADLQSDVRQSASAQRRQQVTFYGVEAADARPAEGSPQWIVDAHCWRRGQDGSIAVYEVATRMKFQRVFETDAETINDRTAAAVARSIVEEIAGELYSLLLRTVLAAQGIDPDKRPRRDRLS
jgi:hypothetical protein